jgi:Zn-finger nucleic acid-binding protein
VKDCPVCHDRLKEVPRHGVLIDVCPRCRGVWLDRGELEKLVSLAGDFEADYDEDAHKRRHEEDYEEPRRKYEDDRFEGHRYQDRDYPHKRDHHKKKKKYGVFDIFGDLFD